MPQTLLAPHISLEEAETMLPRKRWTRDECRRLMELDILPEGKFELIDGDVIYKLGQNQPHVYTCMIVLDALRGVYGTQYVRIPSPIEIDDYNEPEPDVSVSSLPARDYYLTRTTPKPQDLRLAVEVSNSTLSRDLKVKAHLYARAGVLEYWVVDINGRQLIVFRDPTQDGYAAHFILSEDDSVVPLSAPDALIAVRDLLP